jgi:hypothetical protein
MCYRGSPPPMLHSHIFGSQALYYGPVICHTVHACNIGSFTLNRLLDPCEDARSHQAPQPVI